MKKIGFKTAVILLVIVTSIICISFFFWKKNETIGEIKEPIKNQLTVDYRKEIEKLNTVNTKKTKLDLVSQLKEHDSNYTEMRRIINKKVYGTNIDTSISNVILKSTGIWIYDLINNKLEYHKYPYQTRIWDFIIENNKIYYVELSDHREDGVYEWKLNVSNLDFSNPTTLKSGQIYNEVNSPFFLTSDDSDTLLFVSYNDEININNETVEQYISSYNIEIMSETKFEKIVSGEGNHVNKTGTFLQRSDYATRLKKNEIIYTEVSYFDKEITYSLDLKTRNKKIVYINDKLDSYSLTEVIRTNDGYVLSFNTDSTNGKLVLVNNDLDKVNELEFAGYKIFREIYNGDIILYNSLYDNLPYTVISLKEAKFTKKSDFSGENIGHFFLTDGDKLLLFELGNEYYLYELP